jgi:hypothetical protein
VRWRLDRSFGSHIRREHTCPGPDEPERLYKSIDGQFVGEDTTKRRGFIGADFEAVVLTCQSHDLGTARSTSAHDLLISAVLKVDDYNCAIIVRALLLANQKSGLCQNRRKHVLNQPRAQQKFDIQHSVLSLPVYGLRGYMIFAYEILLSSAQACGSMPHHKPTPAWFPLLPMKLKPDA